MAKVDDKVRMAEFKAETGLDAAAIRQAGLRSIDAGKRAMTSTIREDQVSDNGIRYVVKGPGGVVKQMTFTVTWKDTGNDRRTVQFRIGQYLTSAPTILGFIPAGPKAVPALRSAQRFAESLRVELAQK